MGSSNSVRSWNSSHKEFNCKNRNGFSTWYIFCFCPVLDVSLTGDQQRPGPGLMTNVVSNERAFGRQWPDYNSLFHFTSSAINITHTQWEAPTLLPTGLVFVCLWNCNVKMAAHYANVDTIITFQQKLHNSVPYLNSWSWFFIVTKFDFFHFPTFQHICWPCKGGITSKTVWMFWPKSASTAPLPN